MFSESVSFWMLTINLDNEELIECVYVCVHVCTYVFVDIEMCFKHMLPDVCTSVPVWSGGSLFVHT